MLDLDRLFQKILKPATGCTEPVAVAFAVASAAQAAFGWRPDDTAFIPHPIKPENIKDIRVIVNRNIFKNCFSISIPNAEGHKGILMSAALGIFCDPRESLALLAPLDRHGIRGAEGLISRRIVQVDIEKELKAELYIDASVSFKAAGKSSTGRCIIRHEHSNIVRLSRDSETIYCRDMAGVNETDEDEDLKELEDMTIKEMVALVERIPEKAMPIIRKTIDMNTEVCEIGLTTPMGLGTGYFNAGSPDDEDPLHLIARMSAAGCDTRMSGYPVEVMSSAGSGNQGIIGTIPVVLCSLQHGVEKSRMHRAVALSHIITMHLTRHIGYLSALCGVAVKAGIGAACGVVYALGGGPQEISRAVKIMAATLTGMICDGAKESCSLKVGIAADMAVRAAMLAMNKMEVRQDNGIVAITAEETMKNLSELSRSMDPVDQKIMEIMKKKMFSEETVIHSGCEPGALQP